MRLTNGARSEATHQAWNQTRSLETPNENTKANVEVYSKNKVERRNLMKECGTLPKGLKLFLYLWEEVPDQLEPQNPNRPSDNGINHKIASMVFDLKSHDPGITLVTFPPYP